MSKLSLKLTDKGWVCSRKHHVSKATYCLILRIGSAIFSVLELLFLDLWRRNDIGEGGRGSIWKNNNIVFLHIFGVDIYHVSIRDLPHKLRK